MLTINKLNSGYGKLHVLYDLSLEVKNREIVAVLGPNGAGKTTLLNSIFGLADIYSGEILFEKENLVGKPPHIISRRGIAYVFQLMNIFPNLTVEENLRLAAKFTKGSKEEILSRLERIYDLFPILRERKRQLAGTLSGGERQMLAISLGLVRDAKLLLLDEPLAGLAVKYVDFLIKKFDELRRDLGISILLVEQNVRKALEIADRVYVLVSGRIIFEGSSKDLLREEEIMRMYLGVGKE
ncbi:MAG: ABC transporter ATP-binding protein [Sulfolobales archaeon]